MAKYANIVIVLFACPALALGQTKTAVTVCQPLQRDSAVHVFPARLEPSNLVEVRAFSACVVSQIKVRPGELVRQGDVLLEFDKEARLAALQQAAKQTAKQKGELDRLQSLLEQAGKLSQTSDKETLAKNHQDAWAGLQGPLEEAFKLTAAYQKKHPFAPAEKLQSLRSILDRATRLSRALPQGKATFLLEETLRQLRPLLRPALPADDQDAQSLAQALRKLEPVLDQLFLYTAAQSPEALAALKAETGLAEKQWTFSRKTLAMLQVELAQHTLVAPVAGKIVELKARTGDRFEAGAKVGAIATSGAIRISFDVDQQLFLEFQALRQSKKISDFPAQLGLNEEPGFPYAGNLEWADNPTKSTAGQARFYAAFPDPMGALAKKLASTKPTLRVRLPLGKSHPVLMVPQRALGSADDGGNFVLVATPDNLAARRQVALGKRDGYLQAIETGLKADDWVVIGSERLKDSLNQGNLNRNDFVSDIQLVNIRPGTRIEPLRITLPEPK
jgi:RND family efflux transporter MFP subunit